MRRIGGGAAIELLDQIARHLVEAVEDHRLFLRFARADDARPLEGEMLEEVGHAGAPPGVVDAADPETERSREDGRRASPDDQEAHAVVECDPGHPAFELLGAQGKTDRAGEHRQAGQGAQNGRTPRKSELPENPDMRRDGDTRPEDHGLARTTAVVMPGLGRGKARSTLSRFSTLLTPPMSEVATAACWRARK